MPETTPTPDHPVIDWPRFYSGLFKLSVVIPVPGEGESVHPVVLERLLARVQANRQRVDEIGRKLLMRLGNQKGRLGVLKHDLLVARAMYRADPHVRNGRKNQKEIDADIEQLTQHEAGRVAAVHGEVVQLESAIAAVKMTIESFDRAKETLNAMHRGALSEMTGRGGNVH